MASGFAFTDKTQEALASAIALATERSHVNVQPIHIALALLDPSVSGSNGHVGSASSDCLFSNILDKAGADPKELTRALNKRLVREPSQDPPPDNVGFSSSASKVLKEAQKLMRQQVGIFHFDFFEIIKLTFLFWNWLRMTHTLLKITSFWLFSMTLS